MVKIYGKLYYLEKVDGFMCVAKGLVPRLNLLIGYYKGCNLNTFAVDSWIHYGYRTNNKTKKAYS
jgi:hypothetical protein